MPLPTPPKGIEEIRARFGDIRVVDGKVTAPKGWEERNCVVVSDLPGYENRPIYLNKQIVEPLRAALTEGTILRPDYKIKSLGCFNPRMKRTNSDELSCHSWAIAVDLNADDNPLQRLQRIGDVFRFDIPPEWITAFKRCGFTWGGEFKGLTRDPMHFQFCSGY